MSEQKEVDISLLVADAIANNKNLHKMCEKPTPLEVGWIAQKYINKCVCIY